MPNDQNGAAVSMAKRVAELERWARGRIEQCRREEAKFGCGDMSIEAAHERITLTIVLETLGLAVKTAEPSAELAAIGATDTLPVTPLFRRHYKRRIDTVVMP